MVYEMLRSTPWQLQDVQVICRDEKRTSSSLAPSPPTCEAISGTKRLMFVLNLINLTSTCRAEGRRKQKQRTAGPEHKCRCSLESSSKAPLCNIALTFSLLFWSILPFSVILLGRKGVSWGDLQLCIQNRYTKVSVTSTWQETLCPANASHQRFPGLSSLGNFWCSDTLLTALCELLKQENLCSGRCQWITVKLFWEKVFTNSSQQSCKVTNLSPTSEKNATYQEVKGEKSWLSEWKA